LDLTEYCVRDSIRLVAVKGKSGQSRRKRRTVLLWTMRWILILERHSSEAVFDGIFRTRLEAIDSGERQIEGDFEGKGGRYSSRQEELSPQMAGDGNTEATVGGERRCHTLVSRRETPYYAAWLGV